MKREKGSVRKVRSDKKVDVQPTMSVQLKNQLYTLAHLSCEPVKDAAQRLCEKGLEESLIIEEIRQFFRRDYKFKNNITVGYADRPRLKLVLNGDTGKVSIKFPQPVFDRLCDLAFALDLPPTTAATILIKKTLNNKEFMEYYVRSLQGLTDAEKRKIHAFLNQYVWIK